MSASCAITCCCHVTMKQNHCLPLAIITPICVLILWMAIRAQNKIIDIQRGKGKRKKVDFVLVTGALTMAHPTEQWLC